jgi:hypothetical protein
VDFWGLSRRLANIDGQENGAVKGTVKLPENVGKPALTVRRKFEVPPKIPPNVDAAPIFEASTLG